MIHIVFGGRGTMGMHFNRTIFSRMRHGGDAFVIQTGLLMGMRIMGTGFGFFFWMMATHTGVLR
jgi:hypothetical protein